MSARLRVVEVTSYWAEQSVEQHARDEDSGRKQVAAMVTTDQWKRKGICYLFIQYIHTWTVNWYLLLYYAVAVTPERLAQNGGRRHVKVQRPHLWRREGPILYSVSQYLCLKKAHYFRFNPSQLKKSFEIYCCLQCMTKYCKILLCLKACLCKVLPLTGKTWRGWSVTSHVEGLYMARARSATVPCNIKDTFKSTCCLR